MQNVREFEPKGFIEQVCHVQEQEGSAVNDVTRIDVPVNIWVETSVDGTLWDRSRRVETAREVARNSRELHDIVRAYTAVCEAAKPRFVPVAPWFRVVVQGIPTGTVLAVVPRWWHANARRYETTGGEWMITDNETAYRAWGLNLVRARLTLPPEPGTLAA